MRRRLARTSVATFTLTAVAFLAACGGDSDAAAGSGEAIEIAVSPSGLALYIASEEGFFGDDVDIQVSQVGYDQSAALFLAGESPVGYESPLEVAKFVSEGEDFRYMSTAGAVNMINGLVVRAEDADKYQSLDDLAGERVGNPGFGSGTWATFQVIAESEFGINPQEDFDNVTADSGALLGLLESGEIEAALLFSGQSAAALALDQVETVFSFSEAWQEATGEYMVVNGPIARQSWLEENPEAAEAVISGVDQAVAWMKENQDELREGGKYEEWTRAEGWFADAETTEGIMTLLEEGEWYLTSDVYDDAWIDAMYGLIEAGEGLLVDSVPAKEDVFYRGSGPE